jgi:hypothetical protein
VPASLGSVVERLRSMNSSGATDQPPQSHWKNFTLRPARWLRKRSRNIRNARSPDATNPLNAHASGNVSDSDEAAAGPPRVLPA